MKGSLIMGFGEKCFAIKKDTCKKIVAVLKKKIVALPPLDVILSACDAQNYDNHFVR